MVRRLSRVSDPTISSVAAWRHNRGENNGRRWRFKQIWWRKDGKAAADGDHDELPSENPKASPPLLPCGIDWVSGLGWWCWWRWDRWGGWGVGGGGWRQRGVYSRNLLQQYSNIKKWHVIKNTIFRNFLIKFMYILNTNNFASISLAWFSFIPMYSYNSYIYTIRSLSYPSLLIALKLIWLFWSLCFTHKLLKIFMQMERLCRKSRMLSCISSTNCLHLDHKIFVCIDRNRSLFFSPSILYFLAGRSQLSWALQSPQSRQTYWLLLRG